MTIIPAIDIIEGKCVRLFQGDYSRKSEYGDPLEMARTFEAKGMNRLHLVDLDGAKAGRLVNLGILEKIAAQTRLVIDFGGGIRTDKDIRDVFSAGAAMAALGSVMVQGCNKEAGKNTGTEEWAAGRWIKEYGAEKLFIGADVRGEKLAVSGWLEQTEISIFEFLEKMTEAGLRNFFCTDISRDGAMTGPSTALYRKILERFPLIRLTASGGVRNEEDIRELEAAGCDGVIVGRAIYEGDLK